MLQKGSSLHVTIVKIKERKLLKMKKIVVVVVLLLAWSCTPDERIVVDQEVTFSVSGVTAQGARGGRLMGGTDLASVLITIEDGSGNLVVNRKQLALYQFGDNSLSQPLTLKTTGSSEYHLTEFFIINTKAEVAYASPREGSEYAHLVDDPLAIDFIVTKDAITTVTPEVLEVPENADPEDYGYAQFGFKIVSVIDGVFSAFLKAESDFLLTDANLLIEGLGDTTLSDSSVLWTYETALEARANTIRLKSAPGYRVTASKQGYAVWQKRMMLTQGSAVEILLEASGNLMVPAKRASGKMVFRQYIDDRESVVKDIVFNEN